MKTSDPEIKEPQPSERKNRISRCYWTAALWVLLVFGFFFLAVFLFPKSGSGGLGGTGTGSSGTGTGRGESGFASGAGTGSGSLAGKTQGAGKGGNEKSAQTQDKMKKSEGEKTMRPEQSGTKTQSTKTNKKMDPEPVKTKPTSLYSPDDKTQKSSQKDGTDAQSSSYGGSAGGKKGFYGIRGKGNTIFVVDISSSMESPTIEKKSRIDILKIQLRNAILTTSGNKHGEKYMIIAFSNRNIIFPAEDQMKSFARGFDSELKEFLAILQPSGSTNLLGAVQAAGSIASVRKNNIQTIFLLTDGEPNTGWFDILDFMKKNVSSRIVIHCIAIGHECPEMKEISSKYKGIYKTVL